MAGAALAGELSGLDDLRAIAEGRIAPPPVAALLGRGIFDVQPGLVTCSLEVGEHLYNPMGSVHGGVLHPLTGHGLRRHSTLGPGRPTRPATKVNRSGLTLNTTHFRSPPGR